MKIIDKFKMHQILCYVEVYYALITFFPWSFLKIQGLFIQKNDQTIYYESVGLIVLQGLPQFREAVVC